MTELRKRNELIAKWESQGKTRTPLTERIWDELSRCAGLYTGVSSSDSVYFVMKRTGVSKRRVDLDNFTCRCAIFDQITVPCCLIISASWSCNKPRLPPEAFGEQYRLGMHKNAFGGQ